MPVLNLRTLSYHLQRSVLEPELVLTFFFLFNLKVEECMWHIRAEGDSCRGLFHLKSIRLLQSSNQGEHTKNYYTIENKKTCYKKKKVLHEFSKERINVDNGKDFLMDGSREGSSKSATPLFDR